MDQNILLLNAGTRSKLVRYFKETFAGYGKVIVTDSYRLAPALYEGDASYITRWCTQEGYPEEILEIVRAEKIRGVVSLLDPDLPVIARFKDMLEKQGAHCFLSCSDTMDCCFDKYRTYLKLIENGFMSAATYPDMEGFEAAYSRGEIEFPVYCKPVRGSGSAGVEKVYDHNRLQELMAGREKCLIQETMKGQEIGADLYIDRFSGQVVSAFLKKKLKMRSGETDKSVSYLKEELFPLLKRLAECFALEGPVDVDLFEEAGQFYVSEINPRFGGGYLHAYECGVNFPALILKNMQGIQNQQATGQYEEEIYMMKYYDVLVRRMD